MQAGQEKCNQFPLEKPIDLRVVIIPAARFRCNFPENFLGEFGLACGIGIVSGLVEGIKKTMHNTFLICKGIKCVWCAPCFCFPCNMFSHGIAACNLSSFDMAKQ